MEFLVRGAIDQDEPGVFIAFEETADELAANVRSLGFDVDKLVAAEEDCSSTTSSSTAVRSRRTANTTSTACSSASATRSTPSGAKRVVLDTIETLFGGFPNQAILRAELRRLFRWLKDKGVTAVITAERGDGTLTRQGLEEYVSDCVILLDHRVNDQVSTRRLRVVKYRGTAHGTNEYPFLIDEDGFSVLPITSAGLDHVASDERISTGIARLDAMLGGRASTAAAASSSAAPRERARAAWPLTSPGSPACAVSAASISRSKSRRARSCATCARSGSTCVPGSRRACSSSSPGGRPRTAWRCTSR